MPTVTVRALKPFRYHGHLVAAGDIVSIDRPIEALPLARQGLISLSRVLTAHIKAEPEPEPEPVPPKRRRGRPRKTETAEAGVYARRDMRAEE